VVIASLAFLAVVILPVLVAAKKKSARMGCVNHLQAMGLAFKTWEGDNNDRYPQFAPFTNGGAMEIAAPGNMAAIFQNMSNEVTTPKILVCPADREHAAATSLNHLKNTNISYFFSSDANDSFPQSILAGDDNFLVDGVPVKSGLMNLRRSRSLRWSAERHRFIGNVLLADGSGEAIGNTGLTDFLSGNGNETNSIVIP
jgi:hypothetical protein